MRKPYQCKNCKNWYTPNQRPDPEDTCWLCAEKRHAPHQKTGVVDCHYGETSPTHSEIAMAKICADVKTAMDICTLAKQAIGEAAERNVVDDMLRRAEGAAATAKQVHKTVADVMTWAGVFEMPGREGDAREGRFKNIDAMVEVVKQNRRPASDLEMLKRSAKLCAEMKEEADSNMEALLEALVTVRSEAKQWKAPVPAKPAQSAKMAATA